jgi:putative mRNA 3-end processing factor
MLGSSLFKVYTNEFTAVYTGDLNCVDTLTTNAADEIECDYLILEATYGHPSYIFPRRQRIYAEIVAWALEEIRAGRVPTFQVYSAGKAQEIVRLFNLYTRIPVVCHPLVSRVNDAYAENGVTLSYFDAASNEGSGFTKTQPCVFVSTTGNVGPLPDNASRAVATGWALRVPARNCVSFPLSSHADFNMLTRFVRATRAKTVYSFTGFTDVFCSYLRRRFGIDSKPIPMLHQTRIVDFQKS